MLAMCYYSSPKNNVHKVSFCDGTLSVVHRPCARVCINNCFKQLFLLHRKVKFTERLQRCSIDEALPKIVNQLNSMNTICFYDNRNIFKLKNVVSKTAKYWL